MPEMKTLNGYEVVDAKAREDIEALKNAEVDLTGYATEEYVNTAIEAIPAPDLSAKADKVHYHSQYLTEHQSLAEYATQTFVTNKIAEAQLSGEGGEVDLSGYATKDDLANINACDTYFFNPYEIEWQSALAHTPAPAGLAEFAQRFLAGDAVSLWIAYERDTGEITWVTAIFFKDDNGDIRFQRNVTAFDYDGQEKRIPMYRIFSSTKLNTWAIAEGLTYIYTFPNKAYVDNAIAALRAELTGGN